MKVPGQYEEEVFKVQPYVKPLKPFTKCCDKVPCECLVCGNVWNACPESLKAGYGCPKCGDTRIPHEKQVKIIEEANPKVKVIGRVASNTKSVECLCLQCGHIWKAKPFNLKRKKPSGCPKCAKSGFNSFRESWLYVLVDDLEIPTQMKIGITNNLEGRLSVLRRHTPFQFHVVKTYSFEPGYDAKSLEKLVHTIFHYLNCGYTNFDGATEWFWYSHNILDFLEDNC
ncbi:MAG: GIY-YIG nuclease family protein [Succinivibrio sp.]